MPDQGEELFIAASDGDAARVSELLKSGADVNWKRPSNGDTALIAAAYRGHEAIVTLLLKANADVNAKSNYGVTALMNAAYSGREAIVTLLLEGGADREAKDKNGKTALDKARSMDHDGVVRLLEAPVVAAPSRRTTNFDVVAAPSPIDVRTESWYGRYLQSNSDAINAIANMNKYKKNNGQLKIIGIEGDVVYGERTLQEWTALQADLDKGFKDGTLAERPKNSRVALEDLEEELEWVNKGGKVRYIIVASCPNRIGDNHKVMEQVKATCAEYDDLVKCTFSYAGNLAADFEANMRLG